tara:strand:+ start:441 stop:929 length:489 start_codon:yes stop_codon:yes gene_type:complete
MDIIDIKSDKKPEGIIKNPDGLAAINKMLAVEQIHGNATIEEKAPLIIQYLDQGHYLNKACVLASVHRSTVKRWLDVAEKPKSPEIYKIFRNLLSRLRDNKKNDTVENLAALLDKDWVDPDISRCEQAKIGCATKLLPMLYPELRKDTQVNVGVKLEFGSWG